MVKQLVTYCLIVWVSTAFAQDLTVNKINVVGDYEVYSPVYYKNKLIVCSNKKDEIFHTIIDESNKYPINLFILDDYKKDTLTLKPFEKTFKTKFNDGPITFNKNYTQCFISQNYINLKKENNKLKLVGYNYKNGIWIQDSSFIYNSPNYSLTHPALSEDGNVLFFSSNMPGGFGGFDLWKSVKIKGVWSQPINMGSNINSSENEFFPTLINGVLYFSSARNGYGGLDIYKSNIAENRPPTLLPPPINSNFDDFSLIATSVLEQGYFSSNRSGKDELWKFYYDFPEFKNCDSIIDDNFCYTLYEESAVTIPNQKALIYKWTINGEKRQGVEVRYCFPGPGDYEIILDVEDTIAHIKYDDQSHLNITLDNVIQPYITSKDTVQVNTLFYLSALESNLPYLSNKTFFWEIENKKLVGDQVSYTFKRAGQYNVQLGVVGYEDTIKVTDCVYKTIVCIDKNRVKNLNDEFDLLKTKIGVAYQASHTENNAQQIGETFTLKPLNNTTSVILTENEKIQLNYLARFLKKHPSLTLSIIYYFDAKQNNNVLKEKVVNIFKYLVLSGIESERLSLTERTAMNIDETNFILFNFKIYENN